MRWLISWTWKLLFFRFWVMLPLSYWTIHQLKRLCISFLLFHLVYTVFVSLRFFDSGFRELWMNKLRIWWRKVYFSFPFYLKLCLWRACFSLFAWFSSRFFQRRLGMHSKIVWFPCVLETFPLFFLKRRVLEINRVDIILTLISLPFHFFQLQIVGS